MPDKPADEQFSCENLSAIAIMKLPMEERRRIMAEQAEKLVEHYAKRPNKAY